MQRTSITDFFDSYGAVDEGKREIRQKEATHKREETGINLLTQFYAALPHGRQLFEEAIAALERMPAFTDSIAVNCPRQGKFMDQGDNSKTYSLIEDPDHAISKLLKAPAEHYAPRHSVAVGIDLTGHPRGAQVTERSVIDQKEAVNHKQLSRAGISGTVIQGPHLDKDSAHPLKGDKNALWTYRPNLKQLGSDSGPLSLWVPFPKEGETISLVVWLYSHKPALTCLQHVARHYGSMKNAYMRLKPDWNEDEFSKVFIGATRLLLQNKYPFDPVEAVRLRCKRYDAILFNCLLVHSGTDEPGFRGFACLSSKVSSNCNLNHF